MLAAAAATLVLGAVVALQPPVNSELGKRTSDLGAAFVSVTLTFLVLLVIFLIVGDWGSLSKLREVPAIYLTGGVYGALFVVVSLITVRHLGAGLTIALLIAGQLIVAALLDHYGVLGSNRSSCPRYGSSGWLLFWAARADDARPLAVGPPFRTLCNR